MREYDIALVFDAGELCIKINAYDGDPRLVLNPVVDDEGYKDARRDLEEVFAAIKDCLENKGRELMWDERNPNNGCRYARFHGPKRIDEDMKGGNT